MDLSFIIRTYNEELFVPILLKSIFEQKTIYKYEVIVVDSESNDNTIKVLQKYEDVILLKIKKDEFTYGRSINVGLSVARGRYICLVSAHCILCNQTYIENVVSYLDLNEKIYCIYGEHRALPDTRTSEQTDFRNKFILGIDNCYPNNANAVYRGQIFNEAKFDESVIALEDMEFAIRMRQIGFIFDYFDAMPVYHYHREDNRQIFRRYFREHYVELQMANNFKLQFKNKYPHIFKKFINDCALIISKGKFIKSIYGVFGYRLSELLGIYMAKTLINNKNVSPCKINIIELIYHPKPLSLDVD